jgi:hypothetical protein
MLKGSLIDQLDSLTHVEISLISQGRTVVACGGEETRQEYGYMYIQFRAHCDFSMHG